MAFFNKKEDVIDIELTQFGKHLLSKGELKPEYYAFFDDDIIYDSEYGGFSEGQNDSQSRITEAARQKPQYVFSGIETEIKRLIENSFDIGTSEQDKVNVQATDDREYSLSYPLGRSDVGNSNAPAWGITFLNGEISTSSAYSTSSLGTIPKVQLNTKDVRFYTEVLNKAADASSEKCLSGSIEEVLSQVGESSDQFTSPSDLVFANRVYDDGSYINIVEDQILIEMLERNTPFEEENLEIEVFRVETNQETQKEVLTPLKFMKKPQYIVNGILLDDDQVEGVMQDPTPDCVEYFFNVRVDNEIPIEDLCRAVKRNRSMGLYAPPITCPEEIDQTGGPPKPCPPVECEDDTSSTPPVCADDTEDTI